MQTLIRDARLTGVFYFGLAEALVGLATVGELWMVGYLLVRGVRRSADTTPSLP